jgi:hypothetical protein
MKVKPQTMFMPIKITKDQSIKPRKTKSQWEMIFHKTKNHQPEKRPRYKNNSKITRPKEQRTKTKTRNNPFSHPNLNQNHNKYKNETERSFRYPHKKRYLKRRAKSHKMSNRKMSSQIS